MSRCFTDFECPSPDIRGCLRRTIERRILTRWKKISNYHFIGSYALKVKYTHKFTVGVTMPTGYRHRFHVLESVLLEKPKPSQIETLRIGWLGFPRIGWPRGQHQFTRVWQFDLHKTPWTAKNQLLLPSLAHIMASKVLAARRSVCGRLLLSWLAQPLGESKQWGIHLLALFRVTTSCPLLSVNPPEKRNLLIGCPSDLAGTS